MKKILALILVLAIALSAAACTQRPESDEAGAAVPTGPAAPAQSQPDESAPQEPAAQPSEKPSETPNAEPVDVNDPEPSEAPATEESPEPSEAPEELPEPEENVNENKVDSSSVPVGTATDLLPADTYLLAYIPELPFDGWTASSDGPDSLTLELTNLPTDVQNKLFEYIEDLKEADFKVNEYLYGSLYDAVKGNITLTIMLEGGILNILIVKN